MKKAFLDTNIFVRYIIGDTENSGIDIVELFQQGAEGEIEFVTKTEALIELNYVLKTHYNLDREKVIMAISTILNLGSVSVVDSEAITLEKILKLYANYSQLSLEDCVYLQHCLQEKIDLITLDKKLKNVFEKLKGAVQ